MTINLTFSCTCFAHCCSMPRCVLVYRDMWPTGSAEVSVVATEFDSDSSIHRFLLRPNCSLPWSGVVRFYLGMVAVSFSIAGAFALNGAWLVLPFAGLEMLVLGAALYSVARRCACWQLITIDADTINIYVSVTAEVPLATFKRAWARLELQSDERRWYPPRLTIRSHGQVVEIGHCLNEVERRSLAGKLSKILSSPV